MPQSTIETEFIIITAPVNQALWSSDFNLEHNKDTKIFVDDQTTIIIFYNPIFYRKTKHFDFILFFFFSEKCKGLYCNSYLSQNKRAYNI